MSLPIGFPEASVRLTKTTIERIGIPAGKKEIIVFDDALPGFGLRLREGGSRSWIVQYKVGTKSRRVTLGAVAVLDPDDARRRAKAELACVQLGSDPAAERAEIKARAAVTLAHVIVDYMDRHAAKELRASTARETERYLRRHFAPLGPTPIRNVTRADVAASLARIAKESGQHAANRGRDALSGLFAFAIAEGFCDANPVLGTRRPVEAPRERTLKDDELALVLRHAGSADYGTIVRILSATGQRRDEVGSMRWSEIDLAGAVWRLPAERVKNGKPHNVPLAPSVFAILKDRPRRANSDYVFGSGKGGFSGWSKSKTRLDARIATATASGKPLPDWRLHDLRRSAASGMARLGASLEVVEKCLNHISGSFRGVVGTYQRHDYAAEKRAALDLWGAHVEALFTGQIANTCDRASGR